MASTYNVDYNPYNEIKSVYDAKVGWNNAKTDEERQKYNAIATAARDKLNAYGYGDIVKQISADGADATATRKIMEQYAPKTTTNTTTKAPIETNNLKSNEVNRENAGLFDKYNQSYEDLTKTNPFTTDEAKAILAKYDLAGLQGRDNAVASGSATNGGNIDSYAAANAMRQQASLVNQGQMVVLDAHKQKIDNVRGLLSDMGVNIDRVFNQDETAKNNDVARKSEIASVTGYTPTEWTIQNDDVYSTYLNADGSFKDEMKDIDIQALINSAKASGDTETAKKLAVVRGRKILSNYGQFGQYSNQGDISYMSPQITEAARKANLENETALKSLGIEADLSKYGIDAESKSKLDQIKAQTDAEKELLEFQANLTSDGITKLSDSAIKTADTVIKNINNKLKNHASNDGRDLILPNGDGTYTFNFPAKAPSADSWRWEIIPEIANCSLTEAEKILVLQQLGYDQQDLIDVLGKDYTD